MMASSPPTARRPHQHSASLSRVGWSKSHSALAKIIAIISMTPPPSSPPRPELDAPRLGAGDPMKRPPADGTGCLGVDLRLWLGPSPQIGGGSVEGDSGGPTELSGVVDVVVTSAMAAESGRDVQRATEEVMAAPSVALAEQSLSPAASVAGGGEVVAAAKSSEGECDPEEENAEESRDATAKEAKEKAAFAEQKGTKGREAAHAGTTTTTVTRDRGSLDLLLEAVRQVSGGLFDDDGPVAENPEPAAAGDSAPRKRRSAGRGKKQSEKEQEEDEEEVEWCIPFDLYEEETAPIVRSKRGRNQALPSRYRDSILDPWRKPAALRRHGRATRP